MSFKAEHLFFSHNESSTFILKGGSQVANCTRERNPLRAYIYIERVEYSGRKQNCAEVWFSFKIPFVLESVSLISCVFHWPCYSMCTILILIEKSIFNFLKLHSVSNRFNLTSLTPFTCLELFTLYFIYKFLRLQNA